MSGRSHNSHDDWILPLKKRLVRMWKYAEDPSLKLASSSEQHDQRSKGFRPRNCHGQVYTPPYYLHHDAHLKKTRSSILTHDNGPPLQHASTSYKPEQWSGVFRPWCPQDKSPQSSQNLNAYKKKTTNSNILNHEEALPIQFATISYQPHQWSRKFSPRRAHAQDQAPQLSLNLNADRKNTASSKILNLEEDLPIQYATISYQLHQWSRKFSPWRAHAQDQAPQLSLHINADRNTNRCESSLNHADPPLQFASTSDQPHNSNKPFRSWSFPEQENVPQNSLHLDAADLKRTSRVNNLYQEEDHFELASTSHQHEQWRAEFRPWSLQEQQNVPHYSVHCDASSIPAVSKSCVEEAWHSSGSEESQPSSAVCPLPGPSASDLYASLCSNNEHNNLKKQHKCPHCNRNFTRASSKRSHVSVHSEKLLKYNECGRCFRTRYDLTRHQRVHTGERPYTCSMCGATFTQTSNLIYHMRIHTGEKPYQCNVCEREFRGSSHLKRHMWHHTGEKPYSCSDCLAVFASWDELNRHRNREHFQNK